MAIYRENGMAELANTYFQKVKKVTEAKATLDYYKIKIPTALILNEN